MAYYITLSGSVQGVGLRPEVARLANAHNLAGWVSNGLDGVRILVQGPQARVDEFLQSLRNGLPGTAILQDVSVREAAVQKRDRFEIRSSAAESGRPRTLVPRDVVVCKECLADVADPSNRREGYAFTSCTECGPRFSIITKMPFERPQTEMAGFPLCAQCLAEYSNSQDRRFHAQTITCPVCGPRVWATGPGGQVVARSDSAVAAAVNCLRDGGIVALRGIGGYQLLCDATSEQTVTTLRARKRRHAKPFAVMVQSVEAAERLAAIDVTERIALTSGANPIVLLPAKAGNRLACGVHPGLTTIGVLLPTSPLHWLLASHFDRPLVVTSGNIEGRPLELVADSAQAALAGVADLWLHHNRPIGHMLDDSVVRVIADRQVTLRVGRGLAPLSLRLTSETGLETFAAGGHQKSAFACFNGVQSVLGPHVGDLDGMETRERYEHQARQFLALYETQPKLWVHDLHPEYFTSQWVQSQRGQQLAVQHHHAHIVAGMLEHGWLDREVLGVACDGTGYGPDGTIWGGEFLRASTLDFQRVAHFRPFSLPGGDQAVKEPLRVAIALIRQLMSPDDHGFRFTPHELEAAAKFKALLDKKSLSIQTSSVGRLFDGVASLIAGVTHADFEGQPAQILEAICDPTETRSYSFTLDGARIPQVDWRPVIRQILVDRAAGLTPGSMAMRFHRGVAQVIAKICGQFRDLPIVLGGGVFQNRLLVELLVEDLASHPQPVGLPGVIPPNDGGLAAGQLAVGIARSNQK